MSPRLFTAVEARIDRGVAKARAEAQARQMAANARSVVDAILIGHDSPDDQVDALDALLDAAAARRAAIADREGLMGKLGALCAAYAPVIDLRSIARARAEIKFRRAKA